MRTVDMHCDTISKIYANQLKGDDTGLFENDLHIDVKKLRKGDYLLQNFAMFVQKKSVENPYETCMEMIDCYYRELEKNMGVLAPVYTYDDIERNQREGKISSLLTIEEGAVLKGNPAFLRNFYRMGVRMLTLTWNYENELGYPNAIPECRDKGLTRTGLIILEEMEKLGMIVDVSHLSDGGFWCVCHHAKRPFVASHSNARAVTGHMRNLSDEMIRSLAEHGGVTGLNFYASFVDDSKSPFGKIEYLIKHARHIVNVGGMECLALGTDFDGIDSNIEIGNAGEMMLLWEALKQEGFSEAQLDMIFGKNALRVYKEVL